MKPPLYPKEGNRSEEALRHVDPMVQSGTVVSNFACEERGSLLRACGDITWPRDYRKIGTPGHYQILCYVDQHIVREATEVNDPG